MAALAAVYFADCGYRTLLISADQPPWLRQGLGKESIPRVEPVESVSDLWFFEPELSEDLPVRDFTLLVHLAFLLEADYDCVILDRAPGCGAVARIAGACRKWERIAPPPSAGTSNLLLPSDRQWRLLLSRLWDAEAARLVAVTTPEGFENESFVGKMEEMVAAGLTPGIIVANRLPRVTGADKEAMGRVRDFLGEIFELGARYSTVVADMPVADEKERGALDTLRRGARIFFGMGSQLGTR